MDASLVNNNIKVPEPNITNGSTSNVQKSEEKKEKPVKKAPSRLYNRPHIGVLDVPSISRTPITDTYMKKQEETPHTKYKITPKNKYLKGIKWHAVASVGIVLAGIISLFKK